MNASAIYYRVYRKDTFISQHDTYAEAQERAKQERGRVREWNAASNTEELVVSGLSTAMQDILDRAKSAGRNGCLISNHEIASARGLARRGLIVLDRSTGVNRVWLSGHAPKPQPPRANLGELASLALKKETVDHLLALRGLLPQGVTIDLILARTVSRVTAEMTGLCERDLTWPPVNIPGGDRLEHPVHGEMTLTNPAAH